MHSWPVLEVLAKYRRKAEKTARCSRRETTRLKAQGRAEAYETAITVIRRERARQTDEKDNEQQRV